MPEQVDPASLEGEELERWYRRSPQDIEYERQQAAAARYREFFGSVEDSASPIAQSGGRSPGSAARSDPDVLWIANGSGGFRAIRPGVPDYELALRGPAEAPDRVPKNPASVEQYSVIEAGNRWNKIGKQLWERQTGLPWPITEDGRDFHVAHKTALADGGDNTLANIEPMHPDEHIAQHKANGDYARWARRSSIARAFGGRVAPPTPKFQLNGLGMLNGLSNILGVLNGRIRPDTFEHTLWDLGGYPSPSDTAAAKKELNDAICRSMGINQPGSSCA